MNNNINQKTTISFVERVMNTSIKYSKLYYDIFVKYDYLLFSEAFANKYHMIKAYQDNYLHLLGINTSLSPKEFFKKCFDSTLLTTDFDFNKKGQSPQSVKGYCREKIKVLPNMLSLFNNNLYAQENFKKNKITCLFSTTDDTSFTLGIAENGSPKTLLKNNQLDQNHQKPVDIVLRKLRIDNFYNEILIGDQELYNKYEATITQLNINAFDKLIKSISPSN